jgi:pyridoxal phosphate enzyme (YggS family)
MDHSQLHRNISQVKSRLSSAARDANRTADDIRLIAVSKTKPAQAVRAAFHSGISDFGENYVSEAVDKCMQCDDLDIIWHFLGPLQSNKTRQVAEHFDWIHSVDRVKVAQRLNAQRPEDRAPLKVCIQVNMPIEESKSGVVSSDELLSLATAVHNFDRLDLRGIMAIPAPCSELSYQREQFGRIAELLKTEGLPSGMIELSMGMSADMEAAIAEGSTMVRIGTDIFGARYT